MNETAPLAIAGVSPFVLSVLLGGRYIAFLKHRAMGQYIREDGPQNHQGKAGTPTAGGVLILLATLFGALCVSLLDGGRFLNPAVLSVLGVTLAFGLLGFVDDFRKIAKKHNKGVSGYAKLAVQASVGLLTGWIAMQIRPEAANVDLFGLARIPMGGFYPIFAAFIVTGASNAVNLTDGLDGLASGAAVISFMALALLLTVSGAGDLALLSHILSGACLGFLMFNRHPARVFMGDTGSLSLGGALGALAVMGGVECWLLLLAAIYIVETLSVILQVISFKTTGKRLFRMSPLHHHFELLGWTETRVVYSFITVQFLCCMLALFLIRP